jgi:hypothetical protein
MRNGKNWRTLGKFAGTASGAIVTSLIVLSLVAGVILGAVARVHGLLLIFAAGLVALVVLLLYANSAPWDTILFAIVFWISLQAGYFIGLILQLARASRARSKAAAAKENGASLNGGED